MQKVPTSYLFTHCSVYTSVLISQFISLSPSCPVSTCTLSMSAYVYSCPGNRFICTIFYLVIGSYLKSCKGSPRSPVIKKNTFQCCILGFNPWSGNTSHAMGPVIPQGTSTEAVRPRGRVPGQEKPLPWEACASQPTAALLSATRESLHAAMKIQHSQK